MKIESGRAIEPPGRPPARGDEAPAQTEAQKDSDAVKVNLRGALTKKKLSAIDSDQDGFVSQSELQTARDALTAQGGKTKFIDKVIANYAQLDSSADGKLSLSELKRSKVAQLGKAQPDPVAPAPEPDVQPAPVEPSPEGDIEVPATQSPEENVSEPVVELEAEPEVISEIIQAATEPQSEENIP